MISSIIYSKVSKNIVCLSSQNVLLQMGLNLISLDGKRIRQLRTYAKKCKGCFKYNTYTSQTTPTFSFSFSRRTTLDTGRVWCPWCGNRSLYRVSVIVDSSGRMQYKPLGRKQFSHRGLRVRPEPTHFSLRYVFCILVSAVRTKEWPSRPEPCSISGPAGHVPREKTTREQSRPLIAGLRNPPLPVCCPRRDEPGGPTGHGDRGAWQQGWRKSTT